MGLGFAELLSLATRRMWSHGVRVRVPGHLPEQEDYVGSDTQRRAAECVFTYFAS